LEFTDAFAEPDGTPIADSPVSRVRARLSERDRGTRMELHTTFESHEDMEKLVSMGTVEGLQQAVGQMDALLQGPAMSFPDAGGLTDRRVGRR
jgi:uncharacterized protein YndB with AHSA1/START domain